MLSICRKHPLMTPCHMYNNHWTNSDFIWIRYLMYSMRFGNSLASFISMLLNHVNDLITSYLYTLTLSKVQNFNTLSNRRLHHSIYPIQPNEYLLSFNGNNHSKNTSKYLIWKLGRLLFKSKMSRGIAFQKNLLFGL